MNNAAPAWLRILAALGLIWNLYGVWEYLGSVGIVSSESSTGMGPMPAWVTGAFAISVFAGALGCLALLMLKRWAVLLLVLSLLAVLAQDAWAFLLREGGNPDFVIPLAVTLVAILLAWAATMAAKRGWLF